MNKLEGLLGPGEEKINFDDKKSVEFLSNKIKTLYSKETITESNPIQVIKRPRFGNKEEPLTWIGKTKLNTLYGLTESQEGTRHASTVKKVKQTKLVKRTGGLHKKSIDF